MIEGTESLNMKKNMIVNKSFSWIVINDNILIKVADKSFFKEGSTGIPRYLVADVFGGDIRKVDSSDEVVVFYKYTQYKATIKGSSGNRIKVFFDKELIHKINEDLGDKYSIGKISVPNFKDLDYPLIVFKKIKLDFYIDVFSSEVPFIEVYNSLVSSNER